MTINTNSANLEVFSSYLVKKWDGDFAHSFPISRHRAWSKWHKHYPAISSNCWSCANLREAKERYSWGGDPTPLVAQMQTALASKKSDVVLAACKAIFDWGGVAKERKSGGTEDASLRWINDQAKKSSLHSQIERAVQLLKKHDDSLDAFDGHTLLMNSAMTKVYWAADPDKGLVIYDGRVGAALGLLAREFLKSIGCTTVPDELKFRWGGSRDNHVQGLPNKRNPSEGTLRFPSLFTSSKKDFHHAQMMSEASFLLQQVANKLKNVSVQDLEKALFMIGYDVRHFPQVKSP
jgi:hypothetical protein